MLDDMEYAGAVLRQRLERNGKRLVFVRTVKPRQFCAGLFVLHLDQIAAELPDLTHACDPEAVKSLVFLHMLSFPDPNGSRRFFRIVIIIPYRRLICKERPAKKA